MNNQGRRKLWKPRPAKTPEQYVEVQLLDFARKLYEQQIKVNDIDIYEDGSIDEIGVYVPGVEVMKIRDFVEVETTKHLRSFRGDTAEVAKGRDITMAWSRYAPNWVRFKTRSAVDRLADLAGGEPASG